MNRRIIRRGARTIVATEMGTPLLEIFEQPLSWDEDKTVERLAREAVQIPALLAICERAAAGGDREAARVLERITGASHG
ncbi:hypothetical protein [Blastopirellula marina]|uniref:Uncharacterized protein n=1 Tax=Blastopirellula marina TaxID=124 RepID=A0A2S8GIE2_9BACT|nr:hypothetical protein [Blastopirellula marina]PQO44206.1 hypothetical protein C5Y93_19735 [Blastopirellula marina]